MKILMLLESDFPPDIRVENEIEYLHKLEHEITVACITQKNRPEKEYLAHAKVIRKRISPFRKKTSVGCLKAPFYFNFWRNFLTEILTLEKFDAIHVHDLPLAQVGAELKVKYKIPLLVDLHENWPALIKDAKHTSTFLGKLLSSNKQWEKYESTVLLKADKIITVVEEMKDRICRFGLNPRKVYVIPNVMNLSSIEKHNNNEYKGETLFYAGGLNIHRGLQIAIKGMALLPKEFTHLKLKIVGFGNYKAELEALTKNLKLQEKVLFLGKMTQEETYKEMQKSDIMLIPHLRSVQTNNSSPNKLYQYMYSGKPILSSNCNSLKRVIEKENIGVIYEDNNPNDFVEKVIELIKENSDNHMGENGKKATITQYNWSENQKILNMIYT